MRIEPGTQQLATQYATIDVTRLLASVQKLQNILQRYLDILGPYDVVVPFRDGIDTPHVV